MKKAALIILSALSLTAHAQGTLEHTYQGNYTSANVCRLEDYGDKYIMIDTLSHNLLLFNDDHSLFRTIPTNIPAGFGYPYFYLPSQYLFNNDNKIEVVVICTALYPNTGYTCRLINEDGTVLQTYTDGTYVRAFDINGSWKLMVNKAHSNPQYASVDIYDLPGQWTTNVNIAQKPAGMQHSMAPNPMHDAATLGYTLPAGVHTGTLNIYNVAGVLMRTCTISDQFSNILIARDQLPSGMYTYEILAGQTKTTDKFIIN